ncbi:hypothetical protein ABY41_gp061 [Synechococcus phage ACG-2014i]|uniref:Uncharacterized protein n=1 Tax=Synechococcus phage ACG-2014i TaxID=1493513 RepID=A0A0E3HJ33_9CAUD|nr:hypothetical protein ABY41_gp061 [Synechococcus phage ACG-2014i]AIX26782.1 hypothetical protein Syn7803US120_61 [Synechococcus phage ACG-2014i]
MTNVVGSHAHITHKSILTDTTPNTNVTNILAKYQFNGLERHPANILRLISELEGSYQLLKYMGFEDDMNTIEQIKRPYYKLYFKTKKEYDTNNN